MRDILFRGKRIDTDEWVFGYHIKMLKGCETKHFIIPEDKLVVRSTFIGDVAVEVDPETVGEWTGLVDMHNRKVFEGDLLYRKAGYGDLADVPCGVVEYGKYNCGCCYGVYGWWLTDGDIADLDYEYVRSYVAGNIWDTPELVGENDGHKK